MQFELNLSESRGPADQFAKCRELRIKAIYTHDDIVLDLEDLVSDAFKDKSSALDSIVKVARFPPSASELNNPQRYASLLPESAARPQKRILGQDFFNPRDRLAHITSIETWGTGSVDGANKRQKTQNAHPYSTFNADYAIPSREVQDITNPHSSQLFGTQDSVHQVYDSQKSPPRKRKPHNPTNSRN